MHISTYINTHSNFSSKHISELSVVGEAWLSIFLLMREMCSFGMTLVYVERWTNTVHQLSFPMETVSDKASMELQWTRSSTVCSEYERWACCMMDWYEYLYYVFYPRCFYMIFPLTVVLQWMKWYSNKEKKVGKNYYKHFRKVIISAKDLPRGSHSTAGDKKENREHRRREPEIRRFFHFCADFWKISCQERRKTVFHFKIYCITQAALEYLKIFYNANGILNN